MSSCRYCHAGDGVGFNASAAALVREYAYGSDYDLRPDTIVAAHEKAPNEAGLFQDVVVERRGIEPLTFAMRTRRSPS